MALIPCSKCGKQISSFAKACPACATPPQISTVPPPLPAEAAPAKGADPLVVIALLFGLALLVGFVGKVINKPESSARSAAPSSTPVPIPPPQNFPRAVPLQRSKSFPRAIPLQTPPAVGAELARATPASVTYR